MNALDFCNQKSEKTPNIAMEFSHLLTLVSDLGVPMAIDLVSMRARDKVKINFLLSNPEHIDQHFMSEL